VKNHAALKGFLPMAISGALLISAAWSQDAKARELESERCPDAIVESVGKFFRLEHFAYPEDLYSPGIENGGLILAGVCKPMPDAASRVIAAFAYDAGVDDAGVYNDNKLLLVVYDDVRKRVISSYSETGTIGGGGWAAEVSPSSIKIDTARYILAKNTRAFGLRLNLIHRNCADGIWKDELTLYVMEGRKLRPIFYEVMRRGRLGHDGSDDQGAPCGLNMSIEAEKIISVEKTATHGFADLKLTAKLTAEITGDIWPLNNPEPLSTIAKYDGKFYKRTSDLDAHIDREIDRLFQEIRETYRIKQKTPQ
jgi:hypothetical protein